MGVRSLWKLLAPCKRLRQANWRSMNSAVMAVDLSCWIVESQSQMAVKKAMEDDPDFKPHLKHLFFKICCAAKHGIKLLFVMDGLPPKEKHKLLIERGSFRGITQYKDSVFNQQCDECMHLLDILGYPYINLDIGEAEAYCAQLNQIGFVDGVITSDADAFLFGARNVMRNFTQTKTQLKNGGQSVYDMTVIEEELCFGQRELIALALILGSDYTSSHCGVKSFGIIKTPAFMQLAIDEYKDPTINETTGDWLHNIVYWCSLSEAQLQCMFQPQNNEGGNNCNSITKTQQQKEQKQQKKAQKFIHQIRSTYPDILKLQECIHAYLHPTFAAHHQRLLLLSHHSFHWRFPNIEAFAAYYPQHMPTNFKTKHFIELCMDSHIFFGGCTFSSVSDGMKMFESEMEVKCILKQYKRYKGDLTYLIQWQCTNTHVYKLFDAKHNSNHFGSKSIQISDEKLEAYLQLKHPHELIQLLFPELIEQFHLQEEQKKQTKKRPQCDKVVEDTTVADASKCKPPTQKRKK